jgi:hypothetical protein
MSKLDNKDDKIILASINAMCYPMQFLAPAEKGILINPLSPLIVD